ncbi:MAG TPA: hypothetical protein VLV76_23515, partial [Candidatus Acidoferrum sp.]|nr:hypothetical protein [Candidatus Acidoferrum sp.]
LLDRGVEGVQVRVENGGFHLWSPRGLEQTKNMARGRSQATVASPERGSSLDASFGGARCARPGDGANLRAYPDV